ncbi:hypothetical protein LEMLEM_LOCUS8816 [Lemmus lemmus]
MWHPLPETVARAARAPGGLLLPGGCRAVGGRPQGDWNPSGAAGLRAPWAAGSGSRCWRDRVGSTRPRSPGQSRQATPRRSVSRDGRLGVPGSFWTPRRLRRQPRSVHGASCGGVAAGAQAAADPAIPQSATRAHLCRDKAIRGFSRQQRRGGQMLEVESCALYYTPRYYTSEWASWCFFPGLEQFTSFCMRETG